MDGSSGERQVGIMDEATAEAYVIRMLREGGPMSTMEVEARSRRSGRRCPDQTVIFLAKMRKKCLIKGEASIERRGWLWWVD